MTHQYSSLNAFSQSLPSLSFSLSLSLSLSFSLSLCAASVFLCVKCLDLVGHMLCCCGYRCWVIKCRQLNSQPQILNHWQLWKSVQVCRAVLNHRQLWIGVQVCRALLNHRQLWVSVQVCLNLKVLIYVVMCSVRVNWRAQSWVLFHYIHC